MNLIQKIALWLFNNIPLGRLAPYILGIVLNRRPYKIKNK